MTDVRRWTAAVSLMLVWWVATYGFGALPLPALQPGWFPHLGTLVTNLLGLAAVWVAAVLFQRAGWLGRQGLRVLAGWGRGRARMLWTALPVMLACLGYIVVGRDGVPGLHGDAGTMIGLAVGMLALGLSEETGSRGLPLGVAASTGAVWRAVLVTSAVFGLWHLGNAVFFGSSLDDAWWQVLTAGAFGFCLAGMRLATGSIWPAVLLHAFSDWTQVLTPGAAPLWYQVAVVVLHLGWGAVLVVLSLRLRGAGTVSPGA